MFHSAVDISQEVSVVKSNTIKSLRLTVIATVLENEVAEKIANVSIELIF